MFSKIMWTNFKSFYKKNGLKKPTFCGFSALKGDG